MKKYKDSLIGLIVFIGYLLLSQYSNVVISLLGFNNLPNILKLLVAIIYDLLLLTGCIFIYLKTIVKDFKDFRKNFRYYFNNYAKYWFLNLGLMMISSIIISSLVNVDSSTNQQYIVSLLSKYPIYTFITTIFIAPILEELIFRLTFRKIFKSDILFIFLSGLVFGILHFSVATSIQELLYIISYSIPGWIFAYTLKKSSNIFVPISLHMFHNTIMTILQFILL